MLNVASDWELLFIKLTFFFTITRLLKGYFTSELLFLLAQEQNLLVPGNRS